MPGKTTNEVPLSGIYFSNYYLQKEKYYFLSENKLDNTRKWKINHAKHPQNY